MPNYCNYEMKIKGSKTAIKRVVECLKADYDYGVGKPEHKHFFRVFEVNDEMESEDICFVFGYCAWSVHSCMCDGQSTYYESVKSSYTRDFMGTTLREQSKDCSIEVFTEEEGMCFSEHYLFEKGKCIIDDSVSIVIGGYTKTGKPTKRINWDTYDGDSVIFNPNRLGVELPYKWVLE